MEDLCNECPIKGLCCFHSYYIEELNLNLILTNHHCQYLDTETMSCTIYENRFEINKNCKNIEDAKKEGALPIGCLYLEVGEIYDRPLKILPPDNLPTDFQEFYDTINNQENIYT